MSRLLAAALLACLGLFMVSATHFAYGTQSWSRENKDTTVIQIDAKYAWNRVFWLPREIKELYSASNLEDANGMVDSDFKTTCTCQNFNCRGYCVDKYGPKDPSQTTANNLQYYIYAYSTTPRYEFWKSIVTRSTSCTTGNGCIQQKLYFKVSSVFAQGTDVNKHYIVGVAKFKINLSQRTKWYLYMGGGDRLSNLVNNGDDQWGLLTSINLNSDLLEGPRTEGAPREFAAQNKNWNFIIPVPTKMRTPTIRFSLNLNSDSRISGSGLTRAAPTQGTLSVQSTTGEISWTPTTLGIYAIQLIITETANGEFVPLDFLIEVQKDYTCKEAITAGIGNVAPRMYPTNVRDVCSAKCATITGSACTYCPFYRSFSDSIDVQAYDCNVGNTNLVVLPTSVPISALRFNQVESRVRSMNLPEGINGALTTLNVYYVKYQLDWSPEIDSVDQTFCVKAFDNDASQPKWSFGNYCLELTLVNAAFFYISGIVRDFKPLQEGGHPDFGVKPGDRGVAIIQNTLDARFKPQFVGGSTLSTKSNFDQWWETKEGVNKQVAHSTVLVQRGGNEQPFTYFDLDFTPINNRLLGNNAGKDYNSYFTYEVNTYIELKAGRSYTFRSTDDLWIFIDGKLPNGWKLSGIPTDGTGQATEMTITANSLVTSLNLQYDTIYRCDIFYASRGTTSSGVSRYPEVQLQLPNTVICSALSSGQTEFNQQNGLNLLYIGGALQKDANYFYLGAGGTGESIQAWLANSQGEAQLIKVLQGFQAKFRFQTASSGSSEGFAFVIKSPNSEIKGQGSDGLGYSGISRSVVIEFDMNANSLNKDPSYQHVSVHINTDATTNPPFTGKNSASEDDSVAVSLYEEGSDSPANGPLLTMDNATFHAVTIEYTPAKADVAGPKSGWLRVKFDNILRPVAEAKIDSDMLNAMLGSAAWVGFTMGTSSTKTSRIRLFDLEIVVVPVAPSNTEITGIGDVTAGNSRTATIQTRDACNLELQVGNDEALFEVSLKARDSGAVLAADRYVITFVSLNNGQYQMIYTIYEAGVFELYVTFDGSPLKSMPALITVSPGATDPAMCDISITVVTGDPTKYNVVIIAKDRYGNLQTRGDDQFSLQFAPALNTPAITPVSTNPASRHAGSFSSTIAGEYEVSVFLGGVHVKDSPVTVNIKPGLAEFPPSTVNAQLSAPAGETNSFTVNLRDKYGNIIRTNEPGNNILFSMTPQPSELNSQFLNGRWEVAYMAKKTGTYNVKVNLNGADVETFNIEVGPGPLDPNMCRAAQTIDDALVAVALPAPATSSLNAKVGVPMEFYVSAKDRFQNARNDAGVVFEVTAANDLESQSVVYVNQGVYRVTVTFNKEGTHPVYVKVVNGQAKTQIGVPKTLNVEVGKGPCTSRSVLNTGDSQLINVEAGVGGTLKIQCNDKYGNVGEGNAGGSFAFIFKRQGVQVGGVETSRTGTSNGLETYKFILTIAGLYSLDISAISDLEAVVNSPVAAGGVTVVAGALDPDKCTTSGPGKFGGITGTPVFFFIEARDAYSNLRELHDDTTSMGLVAPYLVSKSRETNNYQYKLQYTVPAPPQGQSSGDFTLTYSVGDGKRFDLPAKIKADSKCYVRIVDGTGAVITSLSSKVGVSNFEAYPQKCTSADYSSCNSAAADSFYLTATSAAFTVAELSEFENEKAVWKFTEFTRTTSQSALSISIALDGVICEMKDPATLAIAVGDVYPPACRLVGLPKTGTNAALVNVPFTWTVALRDKFANIISATAVAQVVRVRAIPYSGSGDQESSCVIDGNDFKCETKLMEAGEWRVNTYFGNSDQQLISGEPKLVQVNPGPPESAIIEFVEASVQAGETVRAVVKAIDAYGNVATHWSPPAGSIDNYYTIAMPLDTKFELISQTYSGNGLHNVQFISKTAGKMNLTATLPTGITVAGELTVAAGPVSPSSLYSTPDTQAGNDIVMTFSPKDEFGNVVNGNGLSVTAYVTSPLGLQTSASRTFSGDEYTFTVKSIPDVQKTGNYAWTISVSNEKLNFPEPGPVTRLLPGPLDLESTQLPYTIPQVMIGTSMEATFIFYDTYGNRMNTSSFDLSQLNLKFYEAYSCDQDLDVAPIVPDDRTSNFKSFEKISLTDGRAVLKAVPSVVGSYLLTITYNGVEYTQCKKFPSVFAVPGLVDPPKCIITAPTSTVAGEPIDITVELKDTESNPVTDLYRDLSNNMKVFVGNKEYTFSAVSTGSAVYALTVMPTQAGKLQLDVRYNNQTMEALKDLAVSSAPLASFQWVNRRDFVAGKWEDMTVASTDAYGNAVLGDDYTFVVTLSRNLGNFEETSYSVPTTVTASCKAVCQTNAQTDLANTQGPYPSPSSQPAAQYKAVFMSTWAGNFDIEISLSSSTNPNIKTSFFTTTIKSAMCPSGQIVCADSSCVDNFLKCAEAPNQTPEAAACTKTLCEDYTCKDSPSDCACPSSASHRCPLGHCVANAASCHSIAGTTCPSYAPHLCATGVCRKNADECPSPVKCPAGFVTCSNGISCARAAADCPAVNPSACPGGTFACPNGKCTQRAEDCSSAITCPSGTNLCPDGSCTSAACNDILPCVDPTNPSTQLTKCSDGSCVASASCPSSLTCPAGYLLCSNLRCALTLDDCGGVNTCPGDMVRCADGNCAFLQLHCGTGVSCSGDYPVLCPDGTCAVTSSTCTIVEPCRGSVTCPDGTCSASYSMCPTSQKCPGSHPVRCSNNECVADASACKADSKCPADVPVKCSDGSCRSNLMNCPTPSTCTTNRPVKCMDGTCAASITDCVSPDLLQCGADQERCKTGECVPKGSLALCPSHVSCPPTHLRCEDGTCRPECPSQVQLCNDQTKPIKCPQAAAGTWCVSNIDLCPPANSCPTLQPIRCSDSTCRDNVASCPHPVGITDGKFPCPDGTFAVLGGCATPTLCPAGAPFLCIDRTCREQPDDCQTSKTCGADAPYYCADRVECLSEESYLSSCAPAGSACPTDSPIKCSNGLCKATKDLCPAEVTEDSSCSAAYFRCRDLSCVSSASDCVSRDPQCTEDTGYERCEDGFCAPPVSEDGTTKSFCNTADGCPWHSPYRCVQLGNCVTDSNKCLPPPSEIYEKEGCLQIVDGFCVRREGDDDRYNRAGCPFAAPYKCHDQRCVADKAACWVQACPSTVPHRCANGFCTTSEKYCPIIAGDYCPEAERARGLNIPCADGSCATGSQFCAAIYPCTDKQKRCNDGSCGDCDDQDNCNCRVTSTCLNSWVRCSDGLCAPTTDDCRPCDSAKCCPKNRPVSCSNGACVETQAECDDFAFSSDGCPGNTTRCEYGECAATESDCLSSSLCPRATPLRCPLSGVCVADLATCAGGSCPVRCANGACATSPADCKTSSSCPLDKPVRCANGECKQYAATSRVEDPDLKCPSTVICESLETVCFDNSCKKDPNFCKLVPVCPASTPVRCADGSCKAESSECGVSKCPPTSPLRCEGGECRSDTVAKCPGVGNDAILGEVSGGGGNATGTGGTIVVVEDRTGISRGCTRQVPVKCFDGSCRASSWECIHLSSIAGAKGDLNGSAITALCPDGQFVCGDGRCAPHKYDCPIVPSCPLGTSRCWNSKCFTDAATCPPPLACPAGTKRCEDGACRAASDCLNFDGCPLTAPYHMKIRECGVVNDGRRLVGDQRCTQDCKAQVKAVPVDLTVDTKEDGEIVFALASDNTNIAKIQYPSGSISSADSATPLLYIRPVGESEMRVAENRVHPSRVESLPSLQFSQTVVSVAFKCETGGNVTVSDRIPMIYEAHIDLAVLGDAKASSKDVCLAYLFEIKSLGYKRWQCVLKNRAEKENFPVAESSNTPWILNGPVSKCGPVGDGRIYAFIHSPLPNPTSTAEPETDWLKENMLGFLLVLMSIVIIVILVFYFAKRLWRYREKYHRERAEVEKMQEEVDNMEQFGGQAGRKDDEVAMSNNPMVLQVKDMQQRLQVTSQEMLEAELAQREQESEERAQHIGSLAKQREEMQNQLNQLQKQLSTVSDMDKATAVATRDDGGYSGGGGGGGPPPVVKGPPPVKKTAFDNKPKKKTQKNF